MLVYFGYDKNAFDINTLISYFNFMPRQRSELIATAGNRTNISYLKYYQLKTLYLSPEDVMRLLFHLLFIVVYLSLKHTGFTNKVVLVSCLKFLAWWWEISRFALSSKLQGTKFGNVLQLEEKPHYFMKTCFSQNSISVSHRNQ